jgi:hypothetical protein
MIYALKSIHPLLEVPALPVRIPVIQWLLMDVKTALVDITFLAFVC